MTKGSVVCLVGPDGVGKTTQAGLLADALRERGLRVKRVWLRFSLFLSLPILALGRLLGLSKQVTYETGSRVGYHEFQESAFVSIAYEVARIVDFWLAYLVKVKLPARLGWFVISDRFYPDVVADVRLSTGRVSRFAISVWRKLQKTMAPPVAVLFLQAPVEVLIRRRADLANDRTLTSKILIYDQLQESLDLTAFDAEVPPGQLHQALMEELLATPGFRGEDSRNRTDPRPSLRSRLNQLHSGFVKRPGPPSSAKTALIVASSWIFQGMLYAGRTEIVFRLGIELGLFLLFATGLGLLIPLYLALPISWVIAHSVNWVFNGQPVVALKSAGRLRTPPWQFDRYLARFETRAKKTACLSFAAVYGSGSRGGLSGHSDLDIKIVRKRGLWSGLRSMFFLMAERTRSTLGGFPLDIYVLDSTAHLHELEGDSEGVVLFPVQPEAVTSHP